MKRIANALEFLMAYVWAVLMIFMFVIGILLGMLWSGLALPMKLIERVRRG